MWLATALPLGPAWAQVNVVVIVADDLSPADLTVYDPGGVPVPHLERLASEGVLMASAYSTSAMCGPSRAGLLTGRYPQRFGFEYNTGLPEQEIEENRGLSTDERTLADLLRDAGYATGAVGKWHLGRNPVFLPTERGFDHFVGILGGGTTYIDPEAPDAIFVPAGRWNDVGDLAGLRADNPVIRLPEDVVVDLGDRYLTDALTDEAIAFVDAHADAPFFLYVGYTAPHTPLQTTQAYWDRFAHLADPAARARASMLAALDDGVGRILDHLDAGGLADDTLVVFTADNGCAPASESCRCDRLRGGKGAYFEGGPRVPMVVRFPTGSGGPGVYGPPTSVLDLVPTVLAATGVAVPEGLELDGVDLGPFVRQEVTGAPHPTLFWRALPQIAMRVGDTKYYWHVDGAFRGSFDLVADPFEQVNLLPGGAQPPNSALQAYLAWRSELSQPAWEGAKAVFDMCGDTIAILH